MIGTFTSTGIEMRSIECYKCGVLYAIPESYAQRRMEDKKSFYCPNGCPGYYPDKSDLEDAKDEAQYERRRAERAEACAQTAKRQRTAIKGHLTRTKNRIAAGMCPCCRRNFENLAKHMAGQHPDYSRKVKK